jgi:hypothetical protein
MKRFKSLRFSLTIGLAIWLGGVVAGDSQIAMEDLSACKLPHGTIEIPEQGSPAALKMGGHILKFTENKLVPSPWRKAERKPRTMEEYVTRVRDERTGDLSYSSLNGGTLISMSGKVRDLGTQRLYELAGKDLDKPEVIWGKEERDSSGKGMPGAIEHVQAGGCYLIETVDGNFALIRIVAQLERVATIQWVFQPNGSTRFDIPKGDATPVTSPATQAEPQVQANDASNTTAQQALTTSVKAHLDSRKLLIRALLEVIDGKTGTIAEKSQAIKVLGEIAATEAAPTLASMIDFFDSEAPSLTLAIDTSFPCVPALARIGKPSVFACMKALSGERSARAIELSAEVIVRVEGTHFGELLLKDAIEKAKGEGYRKTLEGLLERIRTGSERRSIFDNATTNPVGAK